MPRRLASGSTSIHSSRECSRAPVPPEPILIAQLVLRIVQPVTTMSSHGASSAPSPSLLRQMPSSPAMIVLPMASVVHAPGVHADLALHWWLIITFVPLACIAMASLGLVLGTSFEPRNIGLMFGFIILPITFLGGTYYGWTRLAPVTIDGWHWLQILVLINPLIYINEGMRAVFTNAPHMHLYVIYPVVLGFAVLFLTIGLRNFRRRVLS